MPEGWVLGKHDDRSGNRGATAVRDGPGQRSEALGQRDAQLGTWRRLGRFVRDVAPAVEDALNVPAPLNPSARNTTGPNRCSRVKGAVVFHQGLLGSGWRRGPSTGRMRSDPRRFGGRRVEDYLPVDVNRAPELHHHAVQIPTDRDWCPGKLANRAAIPVGGQGVVAGCDERNLKCPITGRLEERIRGVRR